VSTRPAVYLDHDVKGQASGYSMVYYIEGCNEEKLVPYSQRMKAVVKEQPDHHTIFLQPFV
jgi:hypothetical protein